MSATRRSSRIQSVARCAVIAGALMTAVALYLTFVPIGGPHRCLNDVGPGSELTPPCPPFDQAAADRANLFVGTLLYGGPVLLAGGGLVLLVPRVQQRQSDGAPVR